LDHTWSSIIFYCILHYIYSYTGADPRKGQGGMCPLQTHGQQKWSGQLAHDPTKIWAVQIFNAPKTKLIHLKYHFE